MLSQPRALSGWGEKSYDEKGELKNWEVWSPIFFLRANKKSPDYLETTLFFGGGVGVGVGITVTVTVTVRVKVSVLSFFWELFDFFLLSSLEPHAGHSPCSPICVLDPR